MSKLYDPLGSCAALEDVESATRWFRFGDGYLGLRTDLSLFLDRFLVRYSECEVEVPYPGAQAVVEYLVQPAIDGQSIIVSAVRGGSFAELGYALELYAGARSRLGTRDGWRVVTAPTEAEPSLAMSGDKVVVRAARPWKRFVANLAINHVLGLQRNSMFFHGAAMGVGRAGIIILGPKSAGKTTLALALAARGHTYFSDEIAGVETTSSRLLPVPRTASMRAGPSSARVDEALEGLTLRTERLPDGSERRLVPVRQVFPQVGDGEHGLSHILVLGGFSESPTATEFSPSWADVSDFSPLRCSLRAGHPGARTLELLRLLRRVRCFVLSAGSPDATTQLIEQLAEVA